MKINVYIIGFLLTYNISFAQKQQLSLKIVVEEAIYKSLIGSDPIIVANPFSAKFYSKLDLTHPVWNNLKREKIVIIQKDSELVENLWGLQAKLNGVIVYIAAHDAKPNLKKLRYVLDGKEISKAVVDTINTKNVIDCIFIKNTSNDEYFAFINSTKYRNWREQK